MKSRVLCRSLEVVSSNATTPRLVSTLVLATHVSQTPNDKKDIVPALQKLAELLAE
jgi:hypothetical protein